MGQTIDPDRKSHVNDIEGVAIDADGVIHTPYGWYHPVTGEGLPIDAPKELICEILLALICDGEDSALTEPRDLDGLLNRRHGSDEDEVRR